MLAAGPRSGATPPPTPAPSPCPLLGAPRPDSGPARRARAPPPPPPPPPMRAAGPRSGATSPSTRASSSCRLGGVALHDVAEHLVDAREHVGLEPDAGRPHVVVHLLRAGRAHDRPAHGLALPAPRAAS